MKVKLNSSNNAKEPFETLPSGTIVEVEGGSLWMKVTASEAESENYPEYNNRRAISIGPHCAGTRGVITGKNYKRIVQGTFVED